MASYLHRTAQPSTLAIFRSWGSSTGAGRIRLADAKIREMMFINNAGKLFLRFFIIFWSKMNVDELRNIGFG